MMRVFQWRGLASTAFGCAAVALASCQGNIGGGSGLSIPQAPSYNQPAGPAGAAAPSRQRLLEGAVYLSPKLGEVPLPQLAGFAVAIELGTPGSSPAPGSSTIPGAPVKAALNPKRPATIATVRLPEASGSPLADPSASASAALAVPASAGASAPASAASAVPAGKPTSAPSPAGTGPGPKIETKTTIYPDDAPIAPTPIPTGEVQTFYKRVPLVRGYVQPGSDLSLYGLAAIRFTLPASELTPKRGFTIALYENGKHHHDRLLGFDTQPALTSSVVASALTDPVVLKKGMGYLLMLYGDDTGSTPAPVASGYPPPGNNPFPMPSCSPGCPQPAVNNPYAPATPYNPNAPPTPYNPYAPPTPYNPYAPTPYANPFGSPHP